MQSSPFYQNRKPPFELHNAVTKGSFHGASVLIGLFEKPCITNGFLDFRASNFLVFTSQNTPKTASSPKLAFRYGLIIQSSGAKDNRIIFLSFLRAIVIAVALFLYKKW